MTLKRKYFHALCFFFLLYKVGHYYFKTYFSLQMKSKIEEKGED